MAESENLTLKWQAFAQSKNTDEDLFQIIYSESQIAIFLIAYRYLQNKPEAEDVVHDVFMKLLEKRRQFKNVENFEAWVAVLTKNLSLRRLNKYRRRKTDYMQIEDRHIRNSFVFNEAEGMLDKDRILEALNTLGPLNYSKILCSVSLGYSNPEIAEQIGKSEKYVRDRKSLARKALYQQLVEAKLMEKRRIIIS